MLTKASANADGRRFSLAALRRTLTVCCALVLLSAGAAGAGTWTSNGPVGGNGFTVAIDPTSPQTVYTGVNGGGVFKSTDGGDTWGAVNTGITSPGAWAVNAIVVDPATPSRVYAGVGAGVSGGVFRTVDGGASWTLASLGEVTDVAIDPATPTTLYASGGAAVHKSTDGGASWTAVLTGTTFRGIAVDPSSPSTVYVGTLFGSVYKSTDGGASWTPSPTGKSDHVDAIAVDPMDSNVVYAGLEDFGVFKSVDAGMTWTSLGPTVGSQKVSVQQIVVDPTAPDTVYVGGYVAGITPQPGVYRSDDGGASWTATSLVALVRGLAIDPTSPTRLFAATQDGNAVWRTTDGADTWAVANDGIVNTNVGAVATAPSQPGRVWAASAGDGVLRSDDGGASWSPTAFTDILHTTFTIAADPSSADTAYLGTQFDGVFKTVDGGASWSPVSANDVPQLVGALVVDPSNPAIVYAGGFGGVARSTTGGGGWTFVNNGLIPVVTALVIDPAAPGTLYAGTDPLLGPFTGVYKTTNGGGLWTPVNAGLPAVAQAGVQALAIDPVTTSTLYVALEGLGVYKTIDGGASWFAATAGITTPDVRSIVVDPDFPEIVLAATAGGGVFVTTDGGASWSPSNAGLYNPFVRALAIEPGRVYAGTAASGVFVAESPAPPQAIRGKSFVVSDPKPDNPAKRKVTVLASEAGSPATFDLDALVANGATLTVSAEGPKLQTFTLPAPWKRVGTTGARYTDKTGANGPVKLAEVSRSAAGIVKLKVTIVARPTPEGAPQVRVVPPNPGTQGKVLLQVNGGDAYCVGFGGAAGGKVVNKGPLLFKVTNPTAAVCP